jgi:hypothetical protein
MRSVHIIVASWIVLTVANFSYGKAWRGIVPLKSTRADVERLLGPPTGDLFNYNLLDSSVVFQYSNCRCGDPCKKDVWNVPPDTVTLIRVDFKGVVRLADLKIDLADYKKWPGDEDVPGSLLYKNERDGFAIETGGTYVSALTYMPPSKDDHLRCHHNSEPIYRQFEEYNGTTNVQKMIERLDGLAEYLRGNPTHRAYLVSYSGHRSCYGEARTRAALTKRYLVSMKGIDRRRFSILDAGYRPGWVVELWVGNATRQDPPPPRMRALNKREVRITKKCELGMIELAVH